MGQTGGNWQNNNPKLETVSEIFFSEQAAREAAPMCLLYLPLNKNKVTINNRLKIIKRSSISNNIYTKYVVYIFLKKKTI